VQAGDTLSSIAFAYQDYSVTNESIAALNPPMKPNTRVLQIGQEVVILPPGSVDPTTGQLLAPGTTVRPTLTPATTADASLATPTGDTGPTPTPAATDESGPADATAPTYTTVKATFLPFERGSMLWLEDNNQIFVLVNGATAIEGTFSQFQDTWREGMPETDPTIVPPEGFTQPMRSFGQAWRNFPGVRDSLGWSVGEAVNFTALVVRHGDKVLVGGPDSRVYEFAEAGTWNAIDYYTE
jgi:hypothetical protein